MFRVLIAIELLLLVRLLLHMRFPPVAAWIPSQLRPSGRRAKGGACRRAVREPTLCRGSSRPHRRARSSIFAVTTGAGCPNSRSGARALRVREDRPRGDTPSARKPVPATQCGSKRQRGRSSVEGCCGCSGDCSQTARWSSSTVAFLHVFHWACS